MSFIEHATNTQLAKFVTDPIAASKLTEDFDYRSKKGKLNLTTQLPGDIGTEKRKIFDYGK